MFILLYYILVFPYWNCVTLAIIYRFCFVLSLPPCMVYISISFYELCDLVFISSLLVCVYSVFFYELCHLETLFLLFPVFNPKKNVNLFY